MKCNICPRECGVNRVAWEKGFCSSYDEVMIAKAYLHKWEEPCISGDEGSGTVFFTGCNLSCVYCQNYEISDKAHGEYKAVSERGLAEEFLRLQELNANNINLVTPTHYAYKIKEAIIIAKENGLVIPVVYNCGGYEKAETIRELSDVIDIYLTDFKYMNSDIAKKYSRAEDYPTVAKVALKEMVRQKPQLIFDERGMLKSGVIVRNLLLPNNVRNSMDVCEYVYSEYGDDVILSIMNQYTPLKTVSNIEELNRKVTKREYEKLLDFVISLGVNNAYFQEGGVADESFIPVWDYKK